MLGLRLFGFWVGHEDFDQGSILIFLCLLLDLDFAQLLKQQAREVHLASKGTLDQVVNPIAVFLDARVAIFNYLLLLLLQLHRKD